MSPLQFILASLRHFRRIHIAVGLGVAVATAVLTGALLVGDSVRGSLRDLTLARLGRIDEALVAPLFREALADELAADKAVRSHYNSVEPAILLAGTLQAGSGESLQRAKQVTIIGCRSSFWSLGEGGPEKPPADGEVAISEVLARELGVKEGDQLLVRVPSVDALPSESLLQDTEDASKSSRFRVSAVLAPTGLARFGLQPSQESPRNVFLPLSSLQSLLEQPGKASMMLVASERVDSPPNEEASQALQSALRPRLEDYGLRVERVESPTPYIRISSSQLVMRDEMVAAAGRAFKSETIQPVVTYLANTITAGQGESLRKIPYSTVTGVDSIAGIGPLLDEAEQPIVLRDDEIALNRWATDDLKVSLGDPIALTFYEPESTHGKLSERQPPPSFTLKAIVALNKADGIATAASDPKFTPDMPGVTDQASINEWDVPFELVEPRRSQDDKYWDEYRTTPKAFVSLATAKRLWGSRWGSISLLRIPTGEAASDFDKLSRGTAGEVARNLANQLERAIVPAEVGFKFEPIKRKGLAAASGTTPFDGLFLGFSFFLIASAIMLIALLFQLGVAGRAKELGTLAAVGVDASRAARLLSTEGLIVAMLGSAVGSLAGVAYAALMIFGLRTWWVAAVATPFLELHISPRSLLIGWVVGVVIAWLTIRYSIRRMVRLPAGRLLAGQVEGGSREPGAGSGEEFSRWFNFASWPTLRFVIAFLVIVLVSLGFVLSGEAQAGVFFGSGAGVLILLLAEVRHQFRSRRGQGGTRGLTLPALSALNTARHAGRSTLTIGLVASASFLIVAMSAFRLESGDAGTGGFELMATSELPILFDLNTPEGRLDLGFTDPDSDLLAAWRIVSLRQKTGEDASCLNLYKPEQPTVLGVPQVMIERGGFDWASTADIALVDDESTAKNPWLLLNADLGRDENDRPIVPVVIDANTATYSLKVGVGGRLTIPDEVDREMTLEVVGLLRNSVLQGKLLVNEAKFKLLYPNSGGYRFFFIERTNEGAIPALSAKNIATKLESTLARENDPGFDATDTHEKLAAFLAVQNTYLSTFQSLGALGLLLGTIGLAVVQLRSVLERRGELALMRASGFRRGRLVGMVLWENAVLLIGGLAIGCIAAAVALVPQWGPQAAGVPWRTLTVLLGTIAAVGLAAGWLATRSALQAQIVPALRGD